MNLEISTNVHGLSEAMDITRCSFASAWIDSPISDALVRLFAQEYAADAEKAQTEAREGATVNPFDIPSLRYVGDTSHERVNQGQQLPIFEPVAPEGRHSINTLKGWTALVERANTRAFTQTFGRSPASPAELKAWEQSGFSDQFTWSAAPEFT